MFNVKRQAQLHLILLFLWLIMIPVSIVTGWLWTVAFVSACSIYANAVGHWSAWQAANAEKKQDERN